VNGPLYLHWVVLLPLMAVIFHTLFYRKLSNQLVAWISTSVVGASFIFSALSAMHLMSLPASQRALTQNWLPWINFSNFTAHFGFLLDPISMVMVLVVSGIGFLIHLFSIGYMKSDPAVKRYFIFLNLFTVSMLLLVLANNFLQLFLGWEGVGLCSYLLIGFWFHKPEAAGAGKKAFIVNRLGDFGLIIALFLMAVTFGSLDFSVVFAGAATQFQIGDPFLVLVAGLLFLGVVGKSAQFPLYMWLPDAMEGPTPVSALIHAATMVTAGVFLIIRSHILFYMAPQIMFLIAVVGAFTAFFAATIALVQDDIKKVLAYSTVSQLGYMVLACGVGAFSAALFHLMTHAFFKALLFLAAGSVIYSMHHEQNMRKMGGLAKKLPLTFITFVIGSLALAGFPGLAGFFSKDEILAQAFVSPQGHFLFWVVSVVTAGMTAFYMFRAVSLTFLGKTKVKNFSKVTEAPWVMKLPLAVLAIFSLFVGYLNVPKLLGGTHRFENFLHPVFEKITRHVPLIEHQADQGLEFFIMGISIVLVMYSIFIGIRFYSSKTEIPRKVSGRFPKLHQLLKGKYFVDEFLQKVLVEPLKKVSANLAFFWDQKVIDRAVVGLGTLAIAAGKLIQPIQSGNISSYAIGFAGVTLVFLIVVIVKMI